MKPKKGIKKKNLEFDFGTLAIKGRSAKGNILSRNPVARVELSQKGISTLSALSVYFDKITMRLNTEERGELLGKFKEDDKIISIYKSGVYRTTGYELSTHFEDDLELIQKYKEIRILTAVYYSKKDDKYFVKRCNPQASVKPIEFIPTEKGNKLMLVSMDYLPQLEVKYYKKDPKEILTEVISVAEFVEIQGVKARGKKIGMGHVKSLKWLEPLPYEEPEEMAVNNEEMTEEDDDMLEGSSLEELAQAEAKEIFDNVDEQKKKNPDESPSCGEGEQLELLF